MTNEQIFELAEKHGDWDDFGRWTFRDDDQLLAFVDAIQKNEREACARTIDDLALEHPGRADLTAQQCAQAIRARSETTKGCQCQLCLAHTAPVHASDISQERVDEMAKDKHGFECPKCGHCCQQREWFEQPDLARVGEVGVWGDKWVGLTDEERLEVASRKWWHWEDAFDIGGFARAIEQALKEKNT
jgi:hypothetical protein